MMRFGYGFGSGCGWGGWGGGFMMIIPVLLIGLIIYAAVRLLSNRNYDQAAGHAYHSSQALSILKERLARGEINEEEYQQKKEILLRN